MADLPLAALHKNLQTAIELEHSTIPPYLTAMFSISPESNAFAYQTIRGVVMEEMLHMTLACNILNAVGGSPAIDNPCFIPEYPTELDFAERKFDVGLVKFSPASVDTFLKIEKPAEDIIGLGGEKFVVARDIKLDQKTIGEFYEALRKQLIAAVEQMGEDKVFTGDSCLQITPEQYYGSGGEIVEVVDLKSALYAMEIIAEQGEGADHTIYDGDFTNFGQDEEVAHYFRFKEIMVGRAYQKGDSPKDEPSGPPVSVNWDAVAPMIDNPKAKYFQEGSPARQKADEFNQLYSHFLRVLHQTFNGQPQLMMQAVGMMYQMKYIAEALLNIPVKDQITDTTLLCEDEAAVAGPPFEYIPPPERKVFSWVLPGMIEQMNELV